MEKPVKTGVSLLVGTGIGLGLMYLLDPKVGAQRRRSINKAAKSGLSKAQDFASDAAGAGWDKIHDVAGSVAGKVPTSTAGLTALVSPALSAIKDAYHTLEGQLHSHLQDAHDATSDAAGDAVSTGKDGVKAVSATHEKLAKLRDQLVDRLKDKAGDLSEPTRAKYSKLLKDTTLAMGRDEDHHYVGQTACALSSLALGAGLAYFFDSDKGHERRDKMAETVQHSVTEIGQFFRKVGSRLVHRGQDVVDRTSEHFADVTQKAAEIRDNYLSRDDAAHDTAENFVQ